MPAGLDRFSLFWLVLARTGGVFAVAPVLSSANTPAPVLAGLSFLVTLAALPAAATPAGGVPQAVLPFAALAVEQVLIGLAIGFLARVVFFAAQLAGGFLDVQVGLSMGSTVDPLYGGSVSVFGGWFNTLAALVFLVGGGLETEVAALAVSLRHIPVGGPAVFTAAAATVVAALSWSFVTALGLAAPALAVGFVVTVLLGLLSRAMPQLNLLQTAIPLQIITAVIVVVLTLALLLAGFSGLVPDIVSWIGRLWA